MFFLKNIYTKIGLSLAKVKTWFVRNINKPISEKILYLVAFTDSNISPIPVDPFLVLLTIFRPKKWLFYVCVCTLISVLGGLVGYFLGFFLFEAYGGVLTQAYDLHEELQNLGQTLKENAFLSIFLAAFTPIPYQIFTLAAGVFQVDILIFTIASLIGRFLRLLLVSFIFRFLNKTIADLILKYFNILVFILGLAVFLYIFIF